MQFDTCVCDASVTRRRGSLLYCNTNRRAELRARRATSARYHRNPCSSGQQRWRTGWRMQLSWAAAVPRRSLANYFTYPCRPRTLPRHLPALGGLQLRSWLRLFQHCCQPRACTCGARCRGRSSAVSLEERKPPCVSLTTSSPRPMLLHRSRSPAQQQRLFGVAL